MSTTLARPRTRLRRTLAGAVTTALAASTLALLPTSAQAAPTGDAAGGTATWGLSTYLNSSNMGRPNPLAASYVAPAAFDDQTRLSTWGNATGTVADDGTASLSFAGTSVNFAKTGGAWLKLGDLQAEIDSSGNGTVSALVSYGVSVTGTRGDYTFDPTQAPVRGPSRVNLADLSGNSASKLNMKSASATWSGLKGSWSTEFTNFLAGDDSAGPPVPGFLYASVVDNTQPDRALAPFSLSVERAAAQITSAAIVEQTPASLKVAVRGTGYRPGSPGIYVSVGEAGNTNVTDQNQYLGTVWASLDRGGNAGAAVQTDGSFAATLTLNKDAIAKLDPTKSYSVSTMKAHGQAATDPSQNASTPLAIDFAALGLKITSAATINAPAVIHGKAGTVSVTIPTRGSVAATGTVTLSGAVSQTAALVNGTATFTLPKSLSAGAKALTASYSGDANYNASSAAATLRIAKATVKANDKVTKKPTSKKTGKATITVASKTSGTPTGKITVTFKKKGKSTKKVTKTLSSGKGKITVPKLAKGTWKIYVKYNGSTNFAKTATTSVGSVKVTK